MSFNFKDCIGYGLAEYSKYRNCILDLKGKQFDKNTNREGKMIYGLQK